MGATTDMWKARFARLKFKRGAPKHKYWSKTFLGMGVAGVLVFYANFFAPHLVDQVKPASFFAEPTHILRAQQANANPACVNQTVQQVLGDPEAAAFTLGDLRKIESACKAALTSGRKNNQELLKALTQ